MTTSTLENREKANAAGLPDVVADTLPKLLKLRAQEYGNRRAFMRKKYLGLWQRYTWQDVYDHVKYFALGLASLGLERGQTISVVGENEPEQYWTEYAAQSLGGTIVCLYPDMTPTDMQYIVENSDSTFIIAEDQEQVDKALEIKDKLPNLRKIVYWDPRGMWQYHDDVLLRFDEVEELGRAFEKSNPGYYERAVELGKGEDVAVLSYTSGTTGLPKGVMVKQANLMDTGYRLLMSLNLKPHTQYLTYISPAWATEQMIGITLGLLLPLTVNFPEKPETVQENIREIGAELLVLSPRQWESLAAMVQGRMLDASWLRRKAFDLGLAVGRRIGEARLEGKSASPVWTGLYPVANLLVLRPLRDKLGLSKTYLPMCGGSAMAPDVFRFFHSIGAKLRNVYGMTEMGLFTVHQGDHFDLETTGKWFKSHPYFGPPLEWKLSEEGELLVRGGAGFGGYYKNAEASAGKLKDGWFTTGDAVAMNDHGELVYLERVSDMRELATGHRFPPQFIETRLRFSPFIKDAMILGDKEKRFVSALINIDPDTCGRWAEQRNIAYSTFPDLSQKAELRDLIGSEIARVNKVLPKESRIKRFANFPKELDPDEAELTRTRKLRRDFLEIRFKELIDAIYDGKDALSTEVPVKYRDGRTGMVKMATEINTIEPPEVN